MLLLTTAMAVTFGSQPKPLKTWKVICSFRPTKEVQTAFFARSQDDKEHGKEWSIHWIEDAKGDKINLDYYPVRIRQLPTVDGKKWTPAQLLKHVRLNVNEFVNTDLVSFAPYKDQDKTKWQSDDPAGSIILLDIFVYNSEAVKVIDKACLLCSMSNDQLWRFSTIRAGSGTTAVNNPDNPGAHPVSGNREFGYFKGPGEGVYTFYTIGADRATRPADAFFNVDGLDETGFNIADELWKRLQSKIADYVNANGGKAEVVAPTVMRPEWDDVKDSKELFDTTGEPKRYSRSELGF